MRWQVSAVAVMAVAGSTAWTRAVAAQGDTRWSTDVARGDTTPPKNQNTNVAVVFEPSAADLPQAAIRSAVARELGMPEDRTVVAARRELSIGVETSELVVRFTSPDGHTERRVALPDDASQTPEVVRLIAGNLARDQRAAVVVASDTKPQPHMNLVEPATDAATTGTTTGDVRHVKSFRRHRFGLQVAQDLSWEPGTYVCDAGAVHTTYSCYYAGTNTPYLPSANSSLRSVQRGFSLATTRLLATYDYAIIPAVTLGARAGFALRGGPSGSGSGNGVKGSAFLPLHLETRATWWFFESNRLRALIGLGGGVAQIDSKTDYVATCALSSSNSSDGCGSLAGTPPSGTPVQLDVWRKVGRGFVSARVGMELRLWDELGLELDLNAVTTLPAFGFALEPALGAVYRL